MSRPEIPEPREPAKQGRADTYGALGVAAALLFSLVLVGRLIVVSAKVNASLADRRANRLQISAGGSVLFRVRRSS